MSPTRRDLFRFTAGAAAAALATENVTVAPVALPFLPPGTCHIQGMLVLNFRDSEGLKTGVSNVFLGMDVSPAHGIDAIVLESAMPGGETFDITEGSWPALLKAAIGASEAATQRPETTARRERRESELRRNVA